ncbi:MAG: serine/threonine protein kinase [Pyrinomonadaceae bacterium]
MEHSLWDHIQALYNSALTITAAERGAFLKKVWDDDPVLGREVTSLLEADESSGDFLASPIFALGLKIIENENREIKQASGEVVGLTIDNRYLIESKLGHGGIGTVYLARDLTLHRRPVVIKLLHEILLQDVYVLKKFHQEVEALARIDHPGVVSVFGAGELADGKPYIAMQYVQGVTLRSQISSEGMNLTRAASILKQVGAALQDVHEKGIVHRDLKPENIMLKRRTNGEELVKIVDFGIAKVTDSAIAPSTIDRAPLGTVLYMSPEHLRGDRVTARSDIYAVALIAYEMATGRRAFNPVSAPQLLQMQESGVRVKPIDLRSTLSAEGQAVILRGLAADPDNRYQSASEFGDALAAALGADQSDFVRIGPSKEGGADFSKPVGIPVVVVEDAVDSAPSSATTRGKSVLTLRRALAIAIALAVVAVVLGLGYEFRKRKATSANPPERFFSYWLTVQKTRDGQSYQEPFQSSGQEIFENGYKFRVNFSSPDDGYLYVFYESPPGSYEAPFTLIYPTRSRKSALVSKQPPQTNLNTFRGQPGTENFWIVWSRSSLTELETAKAAAFDDPKGAITDSNLIGRVRDFLMKYSQPSPQATTDVTAQQTQVRGSSDILVKLAQFEHR